MATTDEVWERDRVTRADVLAARYYDPATVWTITAIALPHGSHVEMAWVRQFKRTSRGHLFGTAFRLAGRPIFRKYARQIVDNVDALDRQCHDMNDDASATDRTT